MLGEEVSVSGSLGSDGEIQVSQEELYLFQIQRDMLVQATTMIKRHQQRQMDPSEEQRMYQFLIDSGFAWNESLPEQYVKHAEELIKNKKIYLN